MKIKPKIYARSLVNLVAGKNKQEIANIIDDFVKYLHNHQALHLGKQILTEFSKVYNQQYNIMTVKVDSAQKLSSQEQQEITKVMANRLRGEIELNNVINPDLIAGIQLSWEDNLWDDTIAGKLKMMKKNLN